MRVIKACRFYESAHQHHLTVLGCDGRHHGDGGEKIAVSPPSPLPPRIQMLIQQIRVAVCSAISLSNFRAVFFGRYFRALYGFTGFLKSDFTR